MHSDVHISSSSNLKPVLKQGGVFFASQHEVPFIFVSKSKRNLAGRQKAVGLNKEMKERAEEERSPGRQFEEGKKKRWQRKRRKSERRGQNRSRRRRMNWKTSIWR